MARLDVANEAQRRERGGERGAGGRCGDDFFIAASYKILAFVAAALCALALAPLSYGYYTLLRLVVCGVASFGAYLAGSGEKPVWAVLLGLLAVLFSPVIPVYLDRETWAPIDLASAVVLAVSAFGIGRPAKEHEGA